MFELFVVTSSHVGGPSTPSTFSTKTILSFVIMVHIAHYTIQNVEFPNLEHVRPMIKTT